MFEIKVLKFNTRHIKSMSRAYIVLLVLVLAAVSAIMLLKPKSERYNLTALDLKTPLIAPPVWKRDCNSVTLNKLKVKDIKVPFPCPSDFAESVSIHPITGLYYFPLNDSTTCRPNLIAYYPTCVVPGECGEMGSSGLYTYDPETDIWEKVCSYPDDKAVVLGSKISPDGTLWIGTDPGNFGIVYWTIGKGEMKAIREMSSGVKNPSSSKPYAARYNKTIKMDTLLLGTNEICFDSDYSNNNLVWLCSNLDNLALGGIISTVNMATKQVKHILRGLPACAGICDPGNGNIYIGTLLDVICFNKNTGKVVEVCGCMQRYPMYDNIIHNPVNNMLYVTTFSQSRRDYDAIYYMPDAAAVAHSYLFGANYQDVTNTTRTPQKNTEILFVTIDLNKSKVGTPEFYSFPAWEDFDLETTQMTPIDNNDPSKFLLINFIANTFSILTIDAFNV